MFNVLFCLGIGVLAGIILHKLKWVSAIVEKLITVTIYLLLFTLGLKAGFDKTITSHLHTLGLTACLISLFAITGSIAVSWITYNLFFKNQKNEE